MASRRPQVWVVCATVALGAGGLVGQVLLWRGLLAVYLGNELITGIILANWLLAEAMGALCFSKRPKSPHRVFAVFAGLSCLFAVCLPLAMVAARLVRPWAQIALGQPVGAGFVLLSSGLILAPVSFLHGALFPVTGRLFRQDASMSSGASVGMLYVWESIGTLLGALLLVGYFLSGGHGFRLVALIWVATALVLVSRKYATLAARWRMLPAGGAVIAILLLLVLGAGADRLHIWSQARQHAPYPVLAGVSSPYGILTVLDNDGQYLFVVDGQPTYMTPVPDRVWVEEFAHIPLLQHRQPRRVCVIGGGIGGLLDEILKHGIVEHVDYVELDPALFDLFDRFPTDLTERELRDPRVRVHARDGRDFLQGPGPAYDVIWIGTPEPNTLHANRYFTLTFFQALRRRLHPDGILAVGVPGRLAYESVDLRDLQASIFDSLKRAIGNVRMLPGEGQFLYLASPERPLFDVTVEDLAEQLFARGLGETVGMPRHVEQRLHPGWLEWVDEQFQDVPMRPNRDLRPLALFHLISYYQSIHAPWSAAAMRGLRRYGGIAAGMVLACLFLWVLGRRSQSAGSSVLFQVGTTGFTGMVLDLLVIFAFQSALGSVHIWIGLLMAAFMAGAALSANWATRWAASYVNDLTTWLQRSDALLCGFCLLLPVLLEAAVRLAPVSRATSIGLFLFLNAVAGGLTGLLFPLAAAWRGARGEDAGRTAGRLQAADLVGGWTAGLAGATFLVPLLGMYGTCLVLVAIKGLSLFSTRVYLRDSPEGRVNDDG